MRIVYISKDGLEFDNEYDCLYHEFKISLEHLNEIHAYADEGMLDEIPMFADNNMFNEDFYNNSAIIKIDSKEAAGDLYVIADYNGWEELEVINEAGIWEYNQEGYNSGFYKTEK